MLRMLFDAAADFMSVRTGTYDFRVADTTLRLPDRENTLASQPDNASAEERRKLIADLDALIKGVDANTPVTNQDAFDLGRYHLSAAQQRRILGDFDGALKDFDAASLNAERNCDTRMLTLIAAQKAEILGLRGDFDAALSLLTEVALPGFASTFDERSVAGTTSQIAEVLVIRGELDQALRTFFSKTHCRSLSDLQPSATLQLSRAR